MIRQSITAKDRSTFPIGQAVRYKPGFGTYGYEDCLEADGRVPAVVVGYTNTRVRLELTLALRGGSRVRTSVNAASLIRRKDLEAL